VAGPDAAVAAAAAVGASAGAVAAPLAAEFDCPPPPHAARQSESAKTITAPDERIESSIPIHGHRKCASRSAAFPRADRAPENVATPWKPRVMEDAKKEAFDRWVDFASVILISLATVLTAWCGYQAARWGGQQTLLYAQANADRINASVASTRADALTTIDVVMFLQFINAVSENRPEEVAFLRARFRPEMRRAVEAWIATKPRTNPNAPSTPFAMPVYRVSANADVARQGALAAASFAKAQEAEEQADQYVRLTVIFAAVSFLAGISTKFVFPNHIIVVVLGFITLIFGFIRIFGLPVR
jgi:hypothetical protein